MTIPSALVDACERNKFVWHREEPALVDQAYSELSLPKYGQLYDFLKKYCLQFVSDTLPFQLMDVVEDDGISDNVYYARDELNIAPHILPISPYEAESIYAVNTSNDNVLFLTFNDSENNWDENLIEDSFYNFMLKHIR